MTTGKATDVEPRGQIASGHLEQWLGLLRKPEVPDQSTADQLAVAIFELSVPAGRRFIASEAFLLLHEYWANDMPDAVRKRQAQRWCDHLQQFPEWALANAFRWYTSMDNPRRHQKPLEGDIAEQARREMGIVRAAQTRFDTFSMDANSRNPRHEIPVIGGGEIMR